MNRKMDEEEQEHQQAFRVFNWWRAVVIVARYTKRNPTQVDVEEIAKEIAQRARAAEPNILSMRNDGQNHHRNAILGLTSIVVT